MTKQRKPRLEADNNHLTTQNSSSSKNSNNTIHMQHDIMQCVKMTTKNAHDMMSTTHKQSAYNKRARCEEHNSHANSTQHQNTTHIALKHHVKPTHLAWNENVTKKCMNWFAPKLTLMSKREKLKDPERYFRKKYARTLLF